MLVGLVSYLLGALACSGPAPQQAQTGRVLRPPPKPGESITHTMMCRCQACEPTSCCRELDQEDIEFVVVEKSDEAFHAACQRGYMAVYGSASDDETLLRAGLIRRAPAGTGRLRVDGTADDHDHAVCRGCGAIFDVERGRLPRPRLPRKLPDGQAVEGVRIEYLVRCTACRRNTDQPSA